jgi:UDP-glucose 4-epimerase
VPAPDPRTVLVTGGAGFIGSHTCVDLLEAGYDVVVADDLSNSSRESLTRVEALTGRPVPFAEVDLRDEAALTALVGDHGVGSVIHFAGLKAVGESVDQPVDYYEVNLGATLSLIRAMDRHDVRRLVFSSSAAVYGDRGGSAVTESTPPSPTNPYARTKWFIEHVLADVCVARPRWSVISLRYFNPVGAHASGRIGEDPRGIPNNLMPYVMQVAGGRQERLRVFGDDYPTPDGTGVRDYIHVVDLAAGHRAALAHLDDAPGHRVYNLGTGTGTSVLALVRGVEAASGRAIPYEVVGRRAGDVDVLVADPALAERELGWRAERDVAEMCADAWRFTEANPMGYGA